MTTNAVLDSLPAEVLRAICEELMRYDAWADGLRFAGLQTLLVLARTSRLFHEQALNRIWRSIPNYGFLLFTLPSDAWIVEERAASRERREALHFVRRDYYLVLEWLHDISEQPSPLLGLWWTRTLLVSVTTRIVSSAYSTRVTMTSSFLPEQTSMSFLGQ